MRFHRSLSSVALLLIVATPLLAGGCGHKDPYVGTWRFGDGYGYMVIAKTPDRYRLTILFGSDAHAQMPLTRSGSDLVAVLHGFQSKGPLVRSTFDFPKYSRLRFTTGPSGSVTVHETPVGARVGYFGTQALTRASDSTSLPTPTQSP